MRPRRNRDIPVWVVADVIFGVLGDAAPLPVARAGAMDHDLFCARETAEKGSRRTATVEYVARGGLRAARRGKTGLRAFRGEDRNRSAEACALKPHDQ